MASVLNAMDQLKFHPSYASPSALTEEILNDPNAEKDIMQTKTGLFRPQLEHIVSSFPAWKQDRPHGPKAQLSRHDTSAASGGFLGCDGGETNTKCSIGFLSSYRTCTLWPLSRTLSPSCESTCRQQSSFSPAIFDLRDLNDNLDLQRVAGRLLAMITSITPSLDLVDDLMGALISILQNSAVSNPHAHAKHSNPTVLEN